MSLQKIEELDKTESEIWEAYIFLRENNNTISDSTLSFIRKAALDAWKAHKACRKKKELKMKKFKIEFKHTVAEYYTAHIKAETESDARVAFYEDPFGFADDDTPNNSEGLDVEIDDLEEIED